MPKPTAASATTALSHANKLGKDNNEFCMSMWAAWRLRTLCESYTATAGTRTA